MDAVSKACRAAFSFFKLPNENIVVDVAFFMITIFIAKRGISTGVLSKHYVYLVWDE